ncbi:MAG: hypothetical protein ACK4MF_07720 [Hyphomicrobiaceae bacterium]
MRRSIAGLAILALVFHASAFVLHAGALLQFTFAQSSASQAFCLAIPTQLPSSSPVEKAPPPQCPWCCCIVALSAIPPPADLAMPPRRATAVVWHNRDERRQTIARIRPRSRGPPVLTA